MTELATIAPGFRRTIPTGPVATVGDGVLKQCYGYLGFMGVWPSGWAQMTATLYAAVAHAKDPDTGLPVFPNMPRLFFTSRAGGSGKSWLARQTAALCPNGKSLVEMTKASMVDLIYQRATVTVTELDVAVGTGRRMQWLTGIINAGYEPDHMTTRKQGGKVQEIPLFGPVILDGLDSVIYATGEHLKTLLSRCIIVHVARAPDGYRAPRYDSEKRAIAQALNGRLARWMAGEVKRGIGDVVPEVPEGLGNRPAALWEPLFAVADAAGGDWPLLAREACTRIESADGLPGQDELDEARINAALEAWGAAEAVASAPEPDEPDEPPEPDVPDVPEPVTMALPGPLPVVVAPEPVTQPVPVAAAPGPQPVAQLGERQEAILLTLLRYNAPMALADLADRSGTSAGTLRVLLGRMSLKGLVFKAERGKYMITIQGREALRGGGSDA